MSAKPAEARKSPQTGRRWVRALLTIVAIPFTLAIGAALLGVMAVLLTNDRLPALDALLDYRPRIPLRVYTADGKLIGEFGEERRTFTRIGDIPEVMKNAILAAEDARFFDHAGVDPVGVIRAAVVNLAAGGIEQGSSTITMQLAREFFLSPERTYTRKITEILLALRIEETLTKEQIFELYMNQIFLGKHSYGFAAAARTYFDKSLSELSPAEAAMLAGLPKAPSRFNPLVNPRRATERQRYILRRMRENNFLTEAQYRDALEEKLHYSSPSPDYADVAPYVAELARQLAYDLFQDETYGAGLNVHTTIDSRDQQQANDAIRRGVLEFDRKYGYRGPEGFIELAGGSALAAQVDRTIGERAAVDDFPAAVVLAADPKEVRLARGGGQELSITGNGLRFVARALNPRTPAAKRIRPGAIVRIAQRQDGGWEITQTPEVQAAFVAADPRDGAIRALVGGFDFERNKFNRVTQAWRQPGSSFKPFMYSAALERGFMVSTVVNDAPISIDPEATGGQLWEPKNYDGKFDGPMTLREGLARSKNMVSIRVLQQIGPQYVQDYARRFGFDPARNPPYLTLALGAGAATPWQVMGAYSVFANGGFRIEPYLIRRITDAQGRIVAQAHPRLAGDEANRAIDSRNAFIMDTLLRDVVRVGTATRARAVLKRPDIAGKTGTTNDSHDAWFAGYAPGIVGVAWVGYDQPRKLGDRETGGGLALPIWIDYMKYALKDTPVSNPKMPTGIVQIGDDWYLSETRPGQGVASVGLTDGGVATGENAEQIRNQLF